jgi:hypothetical protein
MHRRGIKLGIPMTKPDKVKIDCDDLLSKRGAKLLAETIVNYWHERGYLVVAESFALPAVGSWGVRSNLVNGLPPKHLALRS